MALTKVSTDGVKDDAITSGKIPANAVANSELATNSVQGGNITNSAITNDKVHPSAAIAKSKIETFVNNNADNRLITGSGTANTLEAETGFTYNGSLLHINSGSSGLPKIRLQHSGSGNDVFEITSGLTGVSNGGFGIYDVDASAYRLAIDSSGNVGIGTTTPSSFNSDGRNLVVGTGSGGQGLSIYSANNNYGNIYFADGTSDGSYNAGGILYNHSSNFMRFDTAAAERMRIDSSGNVGIGTTSPDSILHCSFDSGASTPNSGTTPKGIAQSYGGTDNHNAGVWFSADFGGDQGISGMAGTRVSGYQTDLRFYVNESGGARHFQERMRINQHGFVKMMGDMSSHMSATGNNYHEMQADNPHIQILNMKHGSSNGYGIMMQFAHGKSTHWAFRVYNYSSGSNNMFIRTDGDLENINNSYGSTSDIKLKENIVDASSQWNDIKALKVRNFNYKADKNKTKLIGLVAQEAETVCPSLVKEQPDLDVDNKDLGTTTKYLKYSILYMKAIKALQEAQTRIETLEAKVAALEAAK